jgi:hypothetical protein
LRGAELVHLTAPAPSFIIALGGRADAAARVHSLSLIWRSQGMARCTVKAYDLGVHRVPLGLVQSVRKASNWGFDQAQNTPPMNKFLSFTSLLFHPETKLVYCGLTSWQNDLFYAFDPEKKEFRSLEFTRVADRFDVKIHRSFELDSDGTIVGAVAGLHQFPEHPEAPGGKIFTFDPRSEEYDVLGIPSPHDYIQSIALDRRRRIVYGNGYPLGTQWGFDMEEREPFPMKWIAGHKLRCDAEGSLWGQSDQRMRWPGISEEAERIAGAVFNVQTSSPKLYRYNPEDGFTVFDSYLYPVGGKTPSIANMRDGGDGFMYVGGSNGALYRIEKQGGECELLGLASPGGRLEGMDFGPDGKLYLGGGSFYCTRLAVYDPKTGDLTDLGPIHDPQRDESCIIVHALCVTDEGIVYVGETDNCERSGFLWECSPEL